MRSRLIIRSLLFESHFPCFIYLYIKSLLCIHLLFDSKMVECAISTLIVFSSIFYLSFLFFVAYTVLLIVTDCNYQLLLCIKQTKKNIFLDASVHMRHLVRTSDMYIVQYIHNGVFANSGRKSKNCKYFVSIRCYNRPKYMQLYCS